MKKLLILLTSLLLTLSLASCKNHSNTTTTLTNEVESVFGNPNVSRLEFVNVPNQPIEIGHFAEQNIKLKATYIDGTTSYQKVTEALFSKDELEQFKTPGEKYFDFIYKGNHIPLRFTLKESTKDVYYTVTFYDRTGKKLKEKTVKYLSSCEYDESTNYFNYTLNDYYYRFDGEWSSDLSYIYSNLEVKPKYTKCSLENSFDTKYEVYGYPLISKYIDEETNERNSIFYLGRIQNCTIDTFDIFERTFYQKETKVFDIYDEENFYLVYKMFADRISENIMKNYYHETKHMDYDGVIMNSSILDFNLSSTNLEDTLDDNRGESYRFPSFFLENFSDRGYDLSTIDSMKRYDGLYTSTRSLFNIYDNGPYLKYHNGGNEYYFTSDEKIGFYKMAFTCDLDVYIDVRSTKYESDYPIKYYDLKEVNLAFCFVENSFEYKLLHSYDGNFNIYSQNFSIANWLLGQALFDAFDRTN